MPLPKPCFVVEVMILMTTTTMMTTGQAIIDRILPPPCVFATKVYRPSPVGISDLNLVRLASKINHFFLSQMSNLPPNLILICLKPFEISTPCRGSWSSISQICLKFTQILLLQRLNFASNFIEIFIFLEIAKGGWL